jgi:hypothetical protein
MDVASRVPPPGCTVRTVINGRTLVRPGESEVEVPRGVYERKTRTETEAAPEKKKRKARSTKTAGGGVEHATYLQLLDKMKRQRDALDVAIAAIATLVKAA